MKQKLFFTVLILFLATLGYAQDFGFKEMPLLFKEAKTNDIVIVDNEKTIINVNKNLKIPLKHNGFPGKLLNYVPFNIKEKTYLVHDGCGPVLEYRNDSLVRIDNSFLHLNQLGAAKFIYNDEIYYYGGYGVFTYKNILTKYDFKQNEWFLVKTKNPNLVPALEDTFFKIADDYLYVFGGKNEDVAEDKTYLNDKFVYRLDLKKLIWERLKTDFFIDNKLSVSDKISSYSFQTKEATIVMDKTYTYKIDFVNNKLTCYNNYFRQYIVNAIVDKNSVHAILININQTNPYRYFYNKYNFSNLFINPIKKKTFYYEEQPYYLYALFFIVVVGFGFLLYKKRIFISFYLNPSHPFQYWKESQTLYFKGKKVKHLSEDDIKILNKMASHPNQFISLNEFNEMFTIDYETENYAAIVKRREKKLEVFLKLLANVSSYDIKDLLHERKNEVDKRIKEVLFLPNKIKFIQK